MKKLILAIEELANKAKTTKFPQEALHYSQAAINIAQVYSVLHYTKQEKK